MKPFSVEVIEAIEAVEVIDATYLGSSCQGNHLICKVQVVILTKKAQKSQKCWKNNFWKWLYILYIQTVLTENDFEFLHIIL